MKLFLFEDLTEENLMEMVPLSAQAKTTFKIPIPQ
jgi:hypothetical protein